MSGVAVRAVQPGQVDTYLEQLADILLDCVAGGASVSFMADLSRADALRFWQQVAADVARGERALILAEDEAGTILGTVQVVAATAPNQPHRADLAKMLVHSGARGRGIGAALLAAAEAEALRRGRWLLVLDTVQDSAGYRLYQRGGWRKAGTIPDYALWPDGRLCATVYFFKDLRGSGGG